MMSEKMPIAEVESSPQVRTIDIPAGVDVHDLMVMIFAKSHDAEGHPSEKEIGKGFELDKGKYVFSYKKNGADRTVVVEVKGSQMIISGEVEKADLKNIGPLNDKEGAKDGYSLDISLPVAYEETEESSV